MITFGSVTVSEWTKDGAQLPVLTVPLVSDGQIVATVELWGDLMPRGDTSAYVTVGMAIGGFTVIEAEELAALGFRQSMEWKAP